MLVYTENVSGDTRRQQVIRYHARPNGDYFSDCYYQIDSGSIAHHIGGILYEAHGGTLQNDCLLLNRFHPNFLNSYEQTIETFNSVFVSECRYAESAVSPAALTDGRRYPDPEKFFSLFHTDPWQNSLVDHYALVSSRSLLEPEDLGLLWQAFLAENGNLFRKKLFLECIAHNGYRWKSHADVLLERLAKRFRKRTAALTEETLDTLNGLSYIALYVERGRYIVVEIRYLTDKFEIFLDRLDLMPFITEDTDIGHTNDNFQGATPYWE